VEEAAERVRSLKAAKAPQAEVKAAVEAYVALTEAAPKGESKTTTATTNQSPVEAAAEKVRSLKASKAPQAEVKAAVEAYIALTEGGSKGESKSSTVDVQQTPVEAAAEKVRQLKAAKAPQPEVKAAVEHYLSLTGGAPAQASAPAQTTDSSAAAPTRTTASTESKTSTDVEAAAEKVRSLKAAKAPQAEVKAAVEAYIALTEPQSAQSTNTSSETRGEQQDSTAQAGSQAGAETRASESRSSESRPAEAQRGSETQPAADEEAPAVRMHLGE